VRLGLHPHLLDDLASLAQEASHMEPWHNESRGGLPPVARILAPGPVLAILVAVVRVCLEDPPVHHEERLLGRGECRRTAICLAPGTVDRLDDADVITGKWWVDSDERAGVVAYLGDEARCEAVGLRLGAEDAEEGGCGGVVSFRTAGEPAAAAPLASRVEERSCARLFGQVRETLAGTHCGVPVWHGLQSKVTKFGGFCRRKPDLQIRPKSPKLEERKNQRHRLNFATAPNFLTLLQRGDVRRVEPIDATGIKNTTKLTFPE
jgi:hypothetical protein